MQHFLQLMVVGVHDKPMPILLGLAHIVSIAPTSINADISKHPALIEMCNGDMFESIEPFKFLVEKLGGEFGRGS